MNIIELEKEFDLEELFEKINILQKECKYQLTTLECCQKWKDKIGDKIQGTNGLITVEACVYVNNTLSKKIIMVEFAPTYTWPVPSLRN